jgi:hypothetical protein
MAIGTGDHEDSVAGQAVVAGEDIGGEIRAGEMAEVKRPRGVGPSNGDEDVLAHEAEATGLLGLLSWQDQGH